MSTDRRLLLAIVLLGLVLRVVVTWVWFDRLDEDVDGYRGIAQMLVDGRGYANGVTGEPTAFRPPLLPLLLASILALGGGNVGIAILQIFLGTATVFLAGRIAERVLSRGTWLAPLIVAVDPLLLSYTPRVMTEVAAAFALACLLYLLLREWKSGRLLMSGLCFGLAALCRPTVWAFLPIAGAFLCIAVFRQRVRVGEVVKPTISFVIAAIIVVTPWTIRNTSAVDAPVFATTHGGYTLLLSNNPEFYNKVARVDWKTIWDSTPWQTDVETDRVEAGISGERATDQWLYARAITNIQSDPGGCALSCLTKAKRLWSVVPLNESPQAFVKWGVGGFYLLVFAGALAACFRDLSGDRRFVFLAAWVMILAFTGVHLFYWSNARMRAPLGVGIALLSAFGWIRQVAAPENQPAVEQA